MSDDCQQLPSSSVETESPTQQDKGETTVAKTDVNHEEGTFPENVGPGTSYEGWNQLSKLTYVCKLQPIKENKVFKGKHKFEAQWRDVAVKLIPYDDETYKNAQRQLEFIRNPSIIQIYDVGEIQGIVPLVFIAMELCSQNLKEFLVEQQQVPLDFKLCFSFAKQIVDGVACLHSEYFIHRDIKLENILLSPSKNSIQVANFGITKRLPDGHSIATASAMGLGCDGYRAPELLQENSEASFYSDSFSIGIVLAMLFSNGHHPYGSDPALWRTNIADNINLDLSRIVEFEEPYTHKRALLVDLIEKCLRRKPRDRPIPNAMLEHRFFTDARKVDLRDPDELFEPPKNGESERATSILEELKHVPKGDVKVAVQLAEYALMCKQDDSPINELRNFIITSVSLSALEVVQIGTDLYQKDDQNIQAMILFKVGHDLHKQETKVSPNNEVDWIAHRIWDITKAVPSLFEQGGCARDIAKLGVRYMEEMLADLRAVEGADSEKFTLTEAACVINVCSGANRSLEYDKTIRYGEEAIANMRKQFGDSAEDHKAYAGVMDNLGFAYRETAQISKAENCRLEAIRGCTKASDYKNEAERREQIRGSNFITQPAYMPYKS